MNENEFMTLPIGAQLWRVYSAIMLVQDRAEDIASDLRTMADDIPFDSVKCALCGKVFQQYSHIENNVCPRCYSAIEFIYDKLNQIRDWANSKPEPIAETLAEIEVFAVSGMEFIKSFSEVFSDE